MPFLSLILLALISVATTILWGVYGLTGLMNLTALALQFCHDLVSACLEYTAFVKLAFIWAGLTLAASGVVYGLARVVRAHLKVQRGLKNLPLTKSGSLIVIEDETAACAFTCGILKPKVYITRGLLKRLSFSERKAVLLHELHHKKNRDPLRFFAMAFLKDALYYLPLAKDLEAIQRAKEEKEADDSAISAMREGLSLASALVKVAASGKNLSFANASFSDADPAPRIRRILNGSEDAAKRPPLRNSIASFLIATIVVAALIIPAASGAQAGTACSKDHCELHDKGHGAKLTAPDCKTHCEAPKAGHKH